MGPRAEGRLLGWGQVTLYLSFGRTFKTVPGGGSVWGTCRATQLEPWHSLGTEDEAGEFCSDTVGAQKIGFTVSLSQPRSWLHQLQAGV